MKNQQDGEVSRGQIEWLLIAKGIAIFTIVFGHFSPASLPPYWIEIREVNRSYNIPLFFILSGYLFNYTRYSYLTLVGRKAKRLLYPFLTTATLFFLIKSIAGLCVNLKHPINIYSVFALFVDPMNSFVPLLWFLHALFLIFLIYPLFRLVLGNFAILLFSIFLASHIEREFPFVGLAVAHMPFFLVGVILRENVRLSKIALDANLKYTVSSLVIFFFVYVIKRFNNFDFVTSYPYYFILCVTGSALMIKVSHVISRIPDNPIKTALTQMGYYIMSIYLLHPVFESPVRIGLEDYLGIPFSLAACFGVTCGIVCPVLLEKKVLRKNWVAKKFLLGLG